MFMFTAFHKKPNLEYPSDHSIWFTMIYWQAHITKNLELIHPYHICPQIGVKLGFIWINVARVYKFGSLNDTKNSLGVNMARVYQFRVFGNNNPFFAELALPSNLGIRSKLIESSSMIHCVESKRTSCMRAPPENWCSRRVEKVQFRHWTPEVPARAYRRPTTQHREIPSSNIWISFVKGFNAVRDTVMLYISIPARMR